MHDTYEGTSMESFEDAVRKALPDVEQGAPQSFEVTLSVSQGGFVNGPQFRAVLRRA